jgi:alpha-N-arabinofuranosidase
MRRTLAAVLLALALGATEDATIAIDAGGPAPAVNRRAFGHNVEAADPRGIFCAPDATEWNRSTLQSGEGVWDAQRRAPVPAVLERLRALGTSVLRYPGGCLAHTWDWRQAVGPLAQRGDWGFGLDEYLATCAALGAEPLITLPDYHGSVADLVALVEYLNAPADGRHPWADRRAAWGRREPWQVRWFELGNESDHGNHQAVPARRMDAAAYVRWAREATRALRAADPQLRLGVVLVPGSGEEPDCAWNRAVLAGAGPQADFAVVHLYAPVAAAGADPRALARACLAAGDQFERRLGDYRALARAQAGKELPLWVSEFNLMSVEPEQAGRPPPFRFSPAAALMTADLQRRLLDPRLGVLGANYWQAVNGYWGMIETRRGAQVVERPAFAAQRLLARHTGAELLAVAVQAPTGECDGFPGLAPCRGGERQPVRSLGRLDGAGPQAAALAAAGLAARVAGDGLTVELKGVAGELHSPPFLLRVRPPAAPAAGCAYRVALRARFRPAPGSGPGVIGLNVLDQRGWEATHAAIAITGCEAARDWQDFHAVFNAPADCPGVALGLRVTDARAAPVAGRLELAAITVSAETLAQEPAFPLLAATATRSADRRTLQVVAINRSLERTLSVTVALAGARAAGPGRCWRLTADDPVLGRSLDGDPAGAPAPDGVPGPGRIALAPASLLALDIPLEP